MTVLATRAANVVRNVFAPRTRLTGSQWANKYGWIARSSGAAEPGQYSTDRAPYLAEIIDVMCDEVHQDVVINKPAQVGYTEALIQVIAYGIKEDPSGQILVRPSLVDAKDFMKERIDTMLAESPHMQGIIRSEGGRRTSDDTMQRKVYLGGWFVVVGANSPAGLRGRPARRLFGDERSGWTFDARQQGDPWDMGVERTTTFWNAKRIQGSTPGEEGVCPTTDALAKSDWREYHVPCPACGYMEPFLWKASNGTFRLVCDKDPTNRPIPETARYLCLACGVLIPEAEKPRMLRPSSGARWVPRFPDRTLAGFDLKSSLISPWQSWAVTMDKWLKAQGNYERLKIVVTHTLGETWKNPGERIDVHTLRERAEPMPELSAKIGCCVGAVDVQKDRLETLVLGIAAGEEVWALEWESHEAPEQDPTRAEVWESAWKHLTEPRGVPMAAIAIDTGFLTDTAWAAVDQWVKRRVVRQVIGVKGEDGRGRPWIRKPGRASSRRARRPWIIGSDTAKDAIALRLLNPVPPGGPGAFHFSDALDESFYDQLTAEELRVVVVKGRQQRVWRPISKDRTNEALDLTVYALGALYSLGQRFLDKIGEMADSRIPVPASVNAADVSANVNTPAPVPTETIATQRRRPKPRRSGWMWRT